MCEKYPVHMYHKKSKKKTKKTNRVLLYMYAMYVYGQSLYVKKKRLANGCST